MSGLEIVVGTYEQFTVCYRAEHLRKDPSKLYLKEAFAASLHSASVRSIASNGKYVATGGTDDRVSLLDVCDGTEETSFLHHDGTVNSVAFSRDGSYLFTGSADGTMTAINMENLALEKTWKGAHKSAVQSISIHPEGKILLSLGSDMVLKTWDLSTGRVLFTTALHNNSKYGRSLTDVQWSPDGEHFALLGDKVVDVISIETTRSVRVLECDSKPSAMCWFTDDEIAVGFESGELLFTNIHQEDQQEKLQIYESRVKALASLGDYIATASSAGDVSLWLLQGLEFTEVCTQHIGCRPVCLTLLNSGKYEADQEQSENDVEAKANLPTASAGVANRPPTSSAIASEAVKSFAWVNVETGDPVQQAVSKPARKLANSKAMARATVGAKRPTKFIEVPNNEEVTPEKIDKKKRRKGSLGEPKFTKATDDPVQLTVSKLARKRANGKAIARATAGAKRPNQFIEVSIDEGVTPDKTDKTRKRNKFVGAKKFKKGKICN